MPITLLLVDDHKIFRDGLKSLLENQLDLEVVGESDNGRNAVSAAKKLSPDVVIMDVAMPDLNGIEATQKILAENPEIKIVALSMYSDRRFITRMLKAGARGYLLKDCAFEELAGAIQAVLKDQIYLTPRITHDLVSDYLTLLPSHEAVEAPVLTPREREVLQLLAEGRKTKEIADVLKVSVKTIETHRKQIMDKLNIHSVAELTKYALREGLTFLEQ